MLSIQARRTRKRTLPAFPTSSAPGSDEKIAILAERAERGECLFHPADVGGPAESLVLWLSRAGKLRALLAPVL